VLHSGGLKTVPNQDLRFDFIFAGKTWDEVVKYQAFFTIERKSCEYFSGDEGSCECAQRRGSFSEYRS
jgi:hypothetical protein